MSSTLNRDDIIAGIREVIVRLRDARVTATIQIVGGAAIALTIDGGRLAMIRDHGFVPADADAAAPSAAPRRGTAARLQIAGPRVPPNA